jgi:peptide/nickel transport system permease protein
VFSRVIVSARVDLGIAHRGRGYRRHRHFPRLAAGWAGGWTDRIVGRLMDTIMAFPLFVLPSASPQA